MHQALPVVGAGRLSRQGSMHKHLWSYLKPLLEVLLPLFLASTATIIAAPAAILLLPYMRRAQTGCRTSPLLSSPTSPPIRVEPTNSGISDHSGFHAPLRLAGRRRSETPNGGWPFSCKPDSEAGSRIRLKYLTSALMSGEKR